MFSIYKSCFFNNLGFIYFRKIFLNILFERIVVMLHVSFYTFQRYLTDLTARFWKHFRNNTFKKLQIHQKTLQIFGKHLNVS